MKPARHPFYNLLKTRVLPVSLILVAVWFGFLKLVNYPPLDTTPVLIMVWASAVVLIFASFPRILDRVKSIKLKDFEIELQEAVAASTTEKFISATDLESEHFFSDKGELRKLPAIIRNINSHPSKPVLLVVDVRNGRYISIPMLFLYLFFIDLVSESSIIFFISSSPNKRPKQWSDIRRESLIGVISGKKVLQGFFRRFTTLLKIFRDFREARFFEGDYPNPPSENLLMNWYGRLSFEYLQDQLNDNQNLSKRDVENWFDAELSKRTISARPTSLDIITIRDALASKDDFVIAFTDDRLSSVVSLCLLSERVSRRVLGDLDSET